MCEMLSGHSEVLKLKEEAVVTICSKWELDLPMDLQYVVQSCTDGLQMCEPENTPKVKQTGKINQICLSNDSTKRSLLVTKQTVGY